MHTEVVKVNLKTSAIDGNPELNTKVEIWLEFGGLTKDEHLGLTPVHDPELDCGGNTFEEAIINLAKICKAKGYKEHKAKTMTDEEF